MTLTRRGAITGGVAAAALAAVTLGYRRFLGPWYASTPYDDLLHQIVDRQPAARLGQAVLKTMPRFDIAAVAERLRQPGFALERRARNDAAQNRVREADGWIVPESVALYAAMAARFNPA